MEVVLTKAQRLKNFFLKKALPFTKKRDVDWNKLRTIGIISLLIIICGIILIPEKQTESETFHESAESGSLKSVAVENDPTQETLRQIQDSQVGSVQPSLAYLYKPSGGNVGGGNVSDRNSSMILTRGGVDTKTQLSPGVKVVIRLKEKMIVANQAMPAVGVVSKDVTSESGLAIPSGSKVLGDISFDESTNRASISWRSIILSDARERPFSAMGIGLDGQVGVSGSVRSDEVKNAIGQTLTKFVGAYASGSMNKGAFGASEGGHRNGMKNAISETATDQTNRMGENLQKERKWIEVEGETFAVLTQPFTFRDAGVTNGR